MFLYVIANSLTIKLFEYEEIKIKDRQNSVTMKKNMIANLIVKFSCNLIHITKL